MKYAINTVGSPCRVVASALEEGFGVGPVEFYDPTKGEYLDSSNRHVGEALLESILSDPAVFFSLLELSSGCIEQGKIEYDKLASLSGLDLPLIHNLRQYGEMFKALYRGALDLALPFSLAQEKVKELTTTEISAESLTAILLPMNGKDTYWYRRQGLLLHMLHALRNAPAAYAIDTYDAYNMNWLELQFTPLSGEEAFTFGENYINKALEEMCRTLHIPSLSKIEDQSPDDLDMFFFKTREELRDLQVERMAKIKRRERAENDIISKTDEDTVVLLKRLIQFMGFAIEVNETIHQQLCIGTNLLRIAAKGRGLNHVPIGLAYDL